MSSLRACGWVERSEGGRGRGRGDARERERETKGTKRTEKGKEHDKNIDKDKENKDKEDDTPQRPAIPRLLASLVKDFLHRRGWLAPWPRAASLVTGRCASGDRRVF